MKLAALFLLLTVTLAYAEPLDKASEEALGQTMDLLRTPDKRNDEIKKDPKAKAADAQVKSLTGNEANTEKLYELAAQVMQNLVQQSGGDTDKMMKIIEQAEKDPAGFAKTWTPEQQKLLKQLGQDIEKSKAAGKSIP
jgi:hypothetical protein